MLSEIAAANQTTATADLPSVGDPSVVYPTDYCCTIYEHDGFNGAQKTVCADPNSDEIQVYDLDGDYMEDRMSSWWCGKNTGYRFLNNEVKEGYSTNQMSGAGTARNYNSGHNDDISSIHIWRYFPDKQGAVTLYDDDNCTGSSAAFYAPSETFAKYSYNE